MLVYRVRSWFGFGLPHEPAHRAVPGTDAGGVARDHAGVLPSAGELDAVGTGPACGELDGESDAAAVRGPAPFESGRGAGGGEPAVDLVDGQADDRPHRGDREPDWMVHVQSDAQPRLIVVAATGRALVAVRFGSVRLRIARRVPGLRAGVVSDGAGGALCGFGGVDGVSTVSRGPRRSRGAPLGGAVAASGVGTSMVRARP